MIKKYFKNINLIFLKCIKKQKLLHLQFFLLTSVNQLAYTSINSTGSEVNNYINLQ